MNPEKEIHSIKLRLKPIESWQTDLSRQIERLEDKVGRIELRLDRAAKMAVEQLKKMGNLKQEK